MILSFNLTSFLALNIVNMDVPKAKTINNDVRLKNRSILSIKRNEVDMHNPTIKTEVLEFKIFLRNKNLANLLSNTFASDNNN